MITGLKRVLNSGNLDKIEKFIKEHKNKERGKMICLKKY